MLAPNKNSIIAYKIIFIILFISTSEILLADSTGTNINVVLPDIVNCKIVNDTLNVKSRLVQNEESFFKRNEGTILGSALAAFVSLFSIWITTYNRNRRETKEKQFQRRMRENIYCGLLFSIYHELTDHKNILKINREEIKYIRAITIEKGDFVFEKAKENFNAEFINACRLKILEFENYNSNLLPKVSNYINTVKSLNRSFDYKTVFSVLQKLKMPLNEDIINTYFQEIISDLDKIDLGIQELQKLLKKEISRFPQNDILMSEK